MQSQRSAEVCARLPLVASAAAATVTGNLLLLLLLLLHCGSGLHWGVPAGCHVGAVPQHLSVGAGSHSQLLPQGLGVCRCTLVDTRRDSLGCDTL